MSVNRRTLVRIAALAVLFLALAIVQSPVWAQEPTPPPQPAEQGTAATTPAEQDLPPGMIGDFLGLGGVAALITVLVNAGKKIGWVKDGKAQTWSFALNVLGMATYLAVQQLAPSTDIPAADQAAGEFAKIGFIILGLVGQFAITKGTNAVVKGVPVIGFSYSAQAEKLE